MFCDYKRGSFKVRFKQSKIYLFGVGAGTKVKFSGGHHYSEVIRLTRRSERELGWREHILKVPWRTAADCKPSRNARSWLLKWMHFWCTYLNNSDKCNYLYWENHVETLLKRYFLHSCHQLNSITFTKRMYV